MTRCIATTEAIKSSQCTLAAAAAHHVRRVLRAKIGDRLTLVDGAGSRREVEIAEISKGAVSCRPVGEIEFTPAPRHPVALFQCIAKGARMDWLVEKAAELGVDEIAPVVSARAIARFKRGEIVERWQRIADSGLEQCDGAWRTRVSGAVFWDDVIARLKDFRTVVAGALSSDARPIVEFVNDEAPLPDGPIAVVIGPEGDFTRDELDSLRAANAFLANLGDRVLRVETAAIYAITAVSLRLQSCRPDFQGLK